jgi:DNA-binding NarL/FixJ family response regulator
MRLAIPEKQKGTGPLEGREFYILGPRRLQNELIASCLERETGGECFVLEDFNQFPIDDQKESAQPTIVFYDCQGKDIKKLLAELKTNIKHNRPVNHIVLLNVNCDQKLDRKCFSDGIRGVFYEPDSLDIFIKGFRAIIDGKLWLSREVMTKCIFEDTAQDKSYKNGFDKLTERQVDVLALIAVGNTNDEIADKLCISPHTVKTHLYRIFKKINVPNRVQAALWAVKNL